MAKKRPTHRPEPPKSPRPGLADSPYPALVTIALAAGLVALDLFAFLPIRHNGFIAYDDPIYVTDNPNLLHGLTWQSVRWAFTTGRAANWHPLTWLSHLLDVQMFGLSPGPQHLVSLAFHVANTLLVFTVLVRLTGARGKSAFVAALFGVHPLHVESVAWISERKDVLSTLFWWLTTWAYIGYVRRPGIGRYGLVAAAFALGLMAKPMLVTLPFVLLLLDLWPLRRTSIGSGRGESWPPLQSLWPLVLEKLPLVVIAAASSVVTFVVQRQGGAVSGLALLPLDMRLSNAAASYLSYLGKAVWPAELSVYYPFSPTPPYALALISLALLTAGTVAALRLYSRAPYVVVGWLWYLVTLLPVVGLVQVGSQAMADRYTYVPLTGIFILVAWGVPDLVRRWPARRLALPLAAVVSLVALAATARAETVHWKDSISVWEHALDSNRDNYVAHDALGALLVDAGRLDDGIEQLRMAMAISPAFPDTHYNLGVGLMREHHDQEAEAQYREAIRLKPSYAEAHSNLGLVLTRMNQFDAAAGEYAEAVRLDPGLSDAETGLGSALVSLGRAPEAIAHFQTSLRLDPSSANTHYRLGQALMATGRTDAAIAEYQSALRLDGTMAFAHNDLGFALFTRGRRDEALAEYSEAIRRDPTMAIAWNNRGWTLANAGQMSDAAANFREAVRLAPAFVQAHVNLGLALARLGHRDEAAAELREALRLDPGNTTARSALAALGR